MLTDRYGPMADVEAARGDERVGAEVKLQLAGVAQRQSFVATPATDVD